jgi:rfaE bifunctional protein nucleotidyltransferase chain/domain
MSERPGPSAVSSPATRACPKIKDLDELAREIRALKAQGKRVVLSHGVFDLLHVGHIRHFEEAKRMGDLLVVTLTEDKYVNKGPHRPAFPQQLRAESVAALGGVDYVAINRWPSSAETIRLLKPDIYAKGPDYRVADDDITGGIKLEAEAVREVGGEIRFTNDMTFSSSRLLNQYLSPFSKDVVDYLEAFRGRYSADEVLAWVDRCAKARPLVVGEAIIDEYLFCVGIGKSTKDPVLAVLHDGLEPVAGGTLAVANHLAGLCDDVSLVTQLGDVDRREDYVRTALRPNVRPVLLTKSNSPTIRKRRIVDRYFGNRLLEIYVMDDRPTGEDDAVRLCEALDAEFTGRDLTVVADYGHGMLPARAVEALCARAPFLCVNVQSNAGNRGFCTVSKYPSASYVCLAAHEVHLELRDRDTPLRDALVQLGRRIDCPRFTVTQGKAGSLHFDRTVGFTEAPSLATKIQDRVGAGDAVLAVTSLLAFVGAPWDIIAFVGNVVGAELVAELGSSVPLDRVPLSKHIVSLLK